jgi:hypothetical protein
MIQKETTYTALVPTVIGIGEEESRQNGRSGETGQVDWFERGLTIQHWFLL